MISVADLLIDNRIPGNYFASDAYIQGDLEMGLLENRRGDRLLALPDTFLQAIYSGLEKETGQATRLVLFNCGRWWGKNFYTRFREEVTDYYGTSLADMPMVDFLQCLQQCWVTYGWGRIELDHSYQNRGFLVIQIWNSPFAHHAPRQNRPVCFLETGALSSFFSQLTSKDLGCVQTSCESMGSDCNRFVLGLTNRMAATEAMVEEGLEHAAIMQKICA
ncbi:MAG: 4-vinyl reductase [Scytolyngbya sp. HA4215-MV1]|jgi:predicted hydrocarbon binding protein|nr:4-vinyl reductase [Scytolyngbya sp. HA4215-MV1]